MKKKIALVCCRAGSKGIPKKILKNLMESHFYTGHIIILKKQKFLMIFFLVQIVMKLQKLVKNMDLQCQD